MKLLHIGFGTWGLDWIRRVQALPEVRVVALVDKLPGALEAAAKRYGVAPEARFISFERSLAESDAEAVLITSAAATHAPLARLALEAGKHVLVEKPFALSLGDAAELVRLAKTKGLVLMVSQNYRFAPAPEAVRALLAEGVIGEVGSVYVDFRSNMAARLPAGHVYYALENPLLLDMSIHHFDLMRFTLGEAAAVTCTTWNPPGSPFKDAAVASATVALASGATVSYRGSWLGEPATMWAGEWRVEGARGTLLWTSRSGPDLSGERVTLNGRSLKLPAPDHIGRQRVLAAFAEAVRSHTEPPSAGSENLGSLALTLAAIRSAREGQRVVLSQG